MKFNANQIMIENDLNNVGIDPNTRWVLRFFTLLLLIGFFYLCYQAYVKYTSEIRYTVVYFYDTYSDGKTNGMKASYFVEGKERYSNCLTMPCKKIKKGSKYLGYYYVDDPSLFDILYDFQLSDSISAPAEGWEEIPDFLKPK